ncbi:class I SAM-dependent methyltransferase [Tellurirhabdus rosea]|uniref:class I SAM-dependent methyltransferase n=1 Tax=Tellurirhabdus rosea TaxID=2674997 RepID=UPI00225ACCDD|nr:class I SAM-dependent methyltransferase [Tellurirhabdus rosea]
MSTLDRFSGHASLYARYRIDYPNSLYDFLLSRTPNRRRAWDCATGNGQAAVVLADYFDEVEATDLSANQLENAPARGNLTYRVSAAEKTPFPDAHFDLVTVAQALHWFDVDAFHAEVRRVARPGATLAEWGYGLNEVSPEVDRIVRYFYNDLVGPFWDAMRRHVEDQYAQLAFPFADIRHERFVASRLWDSGRFLNYLRTWSSVQKYQKQHGTDPVSLIEDELKAVWGNGEREVRFPIFLRTGRV